MINYGFVREGRNCVLWTRVSTRYQEQNGGSLETQREICEEYAARNDYRILERFGGKHESAKTPGAMIQAMVKYVKRNPTWYLNLTDSHGAHGRQSKCFRK